MSGTSSRALSVLTCNRMASPLLLRIRSGIKPKLNFRCLDFEPRRVQRARWDVIPLAHAIAALDALYAQNELTLRDHANILRFVVVRRDEGALGVRRKQNIAVVRLELEGIKRPFERREHPK